MRIHRSIPLLIALGMLVACTAGPGAGPSLPFISATATERPPQVRVTPAPDAQAAMAQFLEALKQNDLQAMYGMLARSTRGVMTPDEFSKLYNDALGEMGASSLDYKVMSQLIKPADAQVGFQITYHTAIIGDIQRDMVASMVLEDGNWHVVWDTGLIIPELAGGNVLRMDYAIPARGNIYDDQGGPIATQSDAYALGIKPGELNAKSEALLVTQLANVCGLSPTTIQDAYAAAAPDWYVPICEVTKDAVRNTLNLETGGLVYSPYTSRFYPDSGIAPQVVGYASLIQKEDFTKYRRLGYRGDERVGQTGIEKSMEPYLAGKHGGSLYVVDANGQIKAQLGAASAQPADSVFLTIDSNLQRWTQLAFGNFQGAAVVLERDTGRVLAMVSSPGYDPNLFDGTNPNSQAGLGAILNSQSQPLVNRAAQGLYPLGSAFKPITMAAGMESGLYLPITTYDCQYNFADLQQYGGPVLHDWTWEHCQDRLVAGNQCDTQGSQPSGTLTLVEALMRSCNPYFWHIGLDLYNSDRAGDIAEMAKGFGLGAATGIGSIAEAPGNISVPASPIDATNQAIGQGDMQVTPLQAARFAAAIGNGGTLYRPQLIEKIVPVSGDPVETFAPKKAGALPVTPERLAAIQEGMRLVVDNQRGTAYFRLLGLMYPISGKTGTAQSGSGKPHSWFIGYTSAADRSARPDIAVAVIVENAGEGSDFAAPIFRSIVETYYYGGWQSRPWYSDTYGGPTFTPTPFGANATKTPKKKP